MPQAYSATHLRRVTGFPDVRVFARLGSTNRRAAMLVEHNDLKLPAIILASRQTAGRGRGSNTWFADAGSLAVTFVLPALPDRPAQELPLRAGLAALDTLATYINPERLRVKWPNDLLADGKKIAGILCERVRGADFVGIGLNVATNFRAAPAEVRRRAASIAGLIRKPPSRAEVLVQLADRLQRVWLAHDWCERLNRVHYLTGREIAVDTGEVVIRGRCLRIDEQGCLILEQSSQQHRIISGSILPGAGAL